MSTGKVQKDFSENYNRHISSDYIQKLSYQIGSVIESKEDVCDYVLPQEAKNAALVSIGRDGTTVHIREEGYREAMSGTISFHNEKGVRLHTLYLAQSPQYGKEDFDHRFTQEIKRVKSTLKQAKYIGLADGSKDNWTFLEQHVDETILDYWHACEYLTKVSKAVSRHEHIRKLWMKTARKKLKEEDNAALSLLEKMKVFGNKKSLGKTAREGLETAITYFTNHAHQMNYSQYKKENYPIGSGVTEAACKVVVKQRLCQSGMKWYIEKAQKMLNIRALNHSDGRWSQFWKYLDKYGVSV